STCHFVQARHARLVEHRLELGRRSGKKDDVVLFSRDPKAWSSSVFVFKNLGAGQDEGLARVIRGHLDSTRFETLLKSCQDFVIQDELALQNAPNHFASDIIFSGTQAADG